MLVARKTFIARYDGADIGIIRARSHVAEDHPIALAHPGSFVAAPGRQRGSRDRDVIRPMAAARTRRKPAHAHGGLERWRLGPATSECRISARPSESRIRLASTASSELLSILHVTAEADGNETGGLLFGGSSGRLLEIVAVSGPGRQSVRELRLYRNDGPHDLAMVDKMKARGLGRSDIGTLIRRHTLSQAQPISEPSPRCGEDAKWPPSPP